MKETSQKLPIHSYKDKICQEIKSNSSLIICGETGSGKTTQIPQYLYEFGFCKDGMIAITQPRRVAALSIAKRVAQEMKVKLGSLVGYSIRFDDMTSASTKIKYMTDGMLLRELMHDPSLTKYSTVILDEAHERTLRTDVLFGMVKQIQRKRNLKVVIMSATLNAQKFSQFFDNCTIMQIEGRQFPVTIHYASETLSDPLDAALVTIFQIHTDYPKGDVLVFLTGQEEIENIEKLILLHTKELPMELDKLLVVPLYANMPSSSQYLAFEPTPPMTRKIILATNIAETSITLPGIKYVVDTGLSKVRGYNPKIGIESLTISCISQASANQRCGRAGRQGPGSCFRLFTESNYKKLPVEMDPEIKRCNLASVMLLLKASGVEDVVNFDYMDSPPRDSIIGALETLYLLGALNDQGHLSELGSKMCQFPIDPHFSRILIESQKHECTFEIICIISMLSIEPIFYIPHDKKEEAKEIKAKFKSFDGDHLTLLNVIQEFEVNPTLEWCKEHFISFRSMKQIMDIRNQLISLCARDGISTIPNPNVSFQDILKSLLSGLSRHTAILQPDSTYKTVSSHQTVYIHPSSVLFGKKVGVVVYSELVETSRKYMRHVSLIEGEWLLSLSQS